VVGAVLFGILGLGGYLRSGMSAEPAITRLVRRPVEANALTQTPEQKLASEKRVDRANAHTQADETQKAMPPSNVNRDTGAVVAQAAEQPYYCGARTKKGTPCSRKVKGNVRCFQHIGMPAMLPTEQLKVK